MSTAMITSALAIKNLYDDADTSEFAGAIAIHDHIEQFRGKQTIKDFVVESNMVDAIGKVRRLSSIYTIHRVIKSLRSERVDVDGEIMSADQFIAGSEYMQEFAMWDDILRYAKKRDMHILDALDDIDAKDLDWQGIKLANGKDNGKSKLQILREYLESAKGSNLTGDAVATKALDILS